MKPQQDGVFTDPQPVPPAVSAVFGERAPLAVAYHSCLLETAVTRGFIGPKEADRLWDRHILNCAVIGEAIPEGASVVDIGSGAGLPGIPLAIARPDVRVTLVEPMLKRANFLTETVGALGLANVTVVRGRAEDPDVRSRVGRVDVVTSRAVAPLGKLATWSLPFARKGGKMLAMKGVSVADELTRDAKEIRKAGGGAATIFTVGEQHLKEPATLMSIPRVK